ncbi:DUF6685 family protein [Phocoenobacter skyensis]|uniref:DUF6685 family protein n=1 Tax=Phocoenobacter skyensis TaxID=97481 RepID=UPI00277A8DAD|nr:DUF6685 family protein [Pasteurella skyensis]MDP8185341.1 hypothetical protein [Pasteurella skyensis]
MNKKILNYILTGYPNFPLPNFIVKYKLESILNSDRLNFKVPLTKEPCLGQRKYFWTLFKDNCIEWNGKINRYQLGARNNDDLLPLIHSLVVSKRIEPWHFEIQTINNVSSSDADFTILSNLDDIAIKDSKHLISEITQEQLNINMSHHKSKIFSSHDQSVSCELWSGVFTWHNGDGSHHFSAARYIARKLNIPIRLVAELDIYYIDINVFSRLCNKYEIFLLSGKDSAQYILLHNTLRNLKMPFIITPAESGYSHLNQNYDSLKMVAFYKNDKNSLDIIKLFKKYSVMNLCDYFYSLILEQEKKEAELYKILYL